MGAGTRQNALEVEARSLQLGGVERFFSGAGSQFLGSQARHVGPEVSQARVAGVHQVIHRSGADFFTVFHRGHADLHGQLAPFLVQCSQRCHKLFDRFNTFVGLAELVHDLGEALERFALSHQHFTAEQVQRLNAGGAFVQHRNAAVANVLLHAPLGDKAVAAVDLHAVVSGLKTNFGHECLGDRRHECQQAVGLFFGFVVGAVLDDVHLLGGEVHHRTVAFGEGFHGQQHAAHVRVHDDRVSRFVRRFRASQGAHLQTIASVFQAALEADFSVGQALQCGAQASGVHKGEHAVQAFVRRADQETGGRVKVHHAGGVTVDAHFVLQGATGHRVARTDRAICVRQELGHDEQRDTFGAGRCVRQASQHDVDDVVGHVVFTGRDEDLGAGDFVGAVRLRLGLGAQHAQVGAAVRFGQAHGAGPLTRDQFGQVSVLLFRGAVLGDGVHRTVGQARVHAPRPVGFTDHFADSQAQGFRQALATVLNVVSQAWPAAFDELLVGFFKTSRGLNA